MEWVEGYWHAENRESTTLLTVSGVVDSRCVEWSGVEWRRVEWSRVEWPRVEWADTRGYVTFSV